MFHFWKIFRNYFVDKVTPSIFYAVFQERYFKCKISWIDVLPVSYFLLPIFFLFASLSESFSELFMSAIFVFWGKEGSFH